MRSASSGMLASSRGETASGNGSPWYVSSMDLSARAIAGDSAATAINGQPWRAIFNGSGCSASTRLFTERRTVAASWSAGYQIVTSRDALAASDTIWP